jgi:hypothetical protein
VLSPDVGSSGTDRHGERVVLGQRLMQSASDPFLGWAPFTLRDFYVRQLRDMKGKTERSPNRPTARVTAVISEGTLACAHARSVDPAVLPGYIGRNNRLTRSLQV